MTSSGVLKITALLMVQNITYLGYKRWNNQPSSLLQ